MKKIIFFIGMIITLMSCESVLDIKPTNMISGEDVKNDPALVDAFLTKIYNNMNWQKRGTNIEPFVLMVAGGEGNVFAAWQEPYAAAFKIIDENGAHPLLEFWPYENIRSANEIIQILKEATFDENMVKQKVAEARFLRAFLYFDLVIRYGGVPLITEAQSIDQPTEELMVPRNSEKEIYDFIASEMDELVNILPVTYDANNFGRPTKWAAYALKSRAMLYAGSIAQFGTVQLNGLLGIPANEANSYYQKAYDASMQIISESPHTLYKSNADPVKNYSEIFTKDGNSEVIFAEVFSLSLLKTHAWNFLCMPEGFHSSWGSNNWIYLEYFEKWEYKDGSSGKLDWTKLDGKTKFDINELIGKKDPRFLASAFYPESPWQGGTVYMHNSTIGTIPAENPWPKTGPTRNRTKTGFMIRKRVDEAIKMPLGNEDETDWIIFRTAEMYLNAAEAAFERGDEPEARRLINLVRERAGMPAKTIVARADVRNERAVELYIEDHHYWDIRRWRTAIAELNGKGFKGVTWDFYFTENKYTMKLKDADFGRIRTFSERNYYLPIGQFRLADNPNLVENPGY